MRKILFLLTMVMPLTVWAQLFEDSILVDGKNVPAEFMVMSKDEKTCMVGSGHNACIAQYSQGNVTIPSTARYGDETYTVKEINALAFRLCSHITSVDIPEGVTRVGDFAFVGCSSLAEADLPSTLTRLGTGAFINLQEHALRKVKCDALVPPVWEYNDVFCFHRDGIGTKDHTRYKMALYVPDAAKAAYQESRFSDASLGWNTPEGWGNFSSISNGYGATFRIKDVEDLRALRDAVNSGIHFVRVQLEADLILDNENWTAPIGDSREHAFSPAHLDKQSAVFDGQGHTISGLTVRHDFAGLFGHIYLAKITNLTLKNCHFYGNEAAGAVSACTDGNNTYVLETIFCENNKVEGGKYSGGMIGLGTDVMIIQSVCKGGSVSYTSLWGSDDEERWMGGMIGWSDAAYLRGCAVYDETIIADQDRFPNHKTGDMVAGIYETNTPGYVTRCFSTLEPGASVNVNHEMSVYKGLRHTYRNELGEDVAHTFTGSKDETMLCLGVMGLDYWVYCPGEYPMPYHLEHMLPEPQPNKMTLRPATLTTDRVNGLQLDGNDIWINFSDFSGQDHSFLALPMKTSMLWIDDNLTDDIAQGMLPIGKAAITATQGVRYDRKLEAKHEGELTLQVPVFAKDENGKIVLDEDGQPIVESYETVETDEAAYTPTPYPIYLPYDLALPASCKVFRPVRVSSDADGIANVEMEMMPNRKISAYTPCYVEVETGDVALRTYGETHIGAYHEAPTLGDDYTFAGTLFAMTEEEAAQASVYGTDTEAPLRWTLRQDAQAVPAFRAFFRAKGTKRSDIEVSLSRFSDENFEYESEVAHNGNYELTVSKYIGKGGHVVIPSAFTDTIGDEEFTMPVVDIDSDVFAESGAEILSVDLSQCEAMEEVWVDRDWPGTPFYGLSPSALVFLPEGKGNKDTNVVLGNECQRLVLHEGANFESPRCFTAKHVEYDRTLSAIDNGDGTWTPKAYTLCLPYDFDFSKAVGNFDDVGIYLPQSLNNGKELCFYSGSLVVSAGQPTLVVVNKGTIDLCANDVEIKVTTRPKALKVFDWKNGFSEALGEWTGTFGLISNDSAAARRAYVSQSDGRFKRIRNDKEQYRSARIPAFRAFFVPTEPLSANVLSAKYADVEPGGSPQENQLVSFPTDQFESDADFSGYDDDSTGIILRTDEADGSHRYFDLQGRLLQSAPAKGVYIDRGKKIIK